MNLDVGCGHNFRARSQEDVNVDLNVKPTFHRSQNSYADSALDTKKIPNFVLADAQHLPFRNNVFEKVTSTSVLEHVKNPMLMLSEMARVSNRFIYVRTPHRFCIVLNGKRPVFRTKAHVTRGFSCSWFTKAFEFLHCKVLHNQVLYDGPFGFPSDVVVKAEK